jgi:hypothetical protein
VQLDAELHTATQDAPAPTIMLTESSAGEENQKALSFLD